MRISHVSAGAAAGTAEVRDAALKAAEDGNGISTIGSARKAEKSGFFGSCYAGISGIFRSIYSFVCKLICCRFYSSEAKVEGLNTEQWREIKENLEDLRAQFLVKRLTMGISELSDWWTKEFDKLHEEVQYRILHEDMRSLAKWKYSVEDLNTPEVEEMVEEFARDLYRYNDKERDTAFRFVRGLEVVTSETSGRSKPTDDQFVPAYLQNVIDSIEA